MSNQEFNEVIVLKSNVDLDKALKKEVTALNSYLEVVAMGDVWIDVDKQVVMVDITTGTHAARQTAGEVAAKLLGLKVVMC